MTALRVFLFGLGIVLLLGAAVTALVHVAEPIPGLHCFARAQGAPGRPDRGCPEVQYVRHTGIAVGLGAAAVVLIAGSLVRRRRS
ncbi:hypothetical protein [Kitasatospora sp. LaBMicrA B282]|uniref:hypothetical protein n=1 Tax=Kitasatospora sp. LaBMicrA B282 TaxID=3420949 RepID=UPI003D119B5F